MVGQNSVQCVASLEPNPERGWFLMSKSDPLTAQQRALRARLAAHTLHSQVDGREHTAPARQAFLNRFEREVDPDSTLSPAERRRRAEHAKKAYFTRLALRSAQARRQRASS